MFDEDFDRTSDKSDRRNARNRKSKDSSEKSDRFHLAKVFDSQRERKQTKRYLNELY